METVLSLFPGLDLMGTAFAEKGFCVFRGPDPLYNSRIEDFHVPAGVVTGIIAGPPCQDFSKARRAAIGLRPKNAGGAAAGHR